jgi:NodT family efflux transporter outer membrane factor (OMF) lipoprotein
MIAACVARLRATLHTAWRMVCAHAVLCCLTACAVGPDYRRSSVQVPETFKEGVEWQRAHANPQGAISSAWWLQYNDDELSRLVDAALAANQSIAAAEANHRLAQAMVAASVASLYPTVSAGFSGTRAQTALGESTAGTIAGTNTVISANVSASWEPDLWGQIRREIESSKASAQASDAELAGERLSIAASVATDYFELRQADIDTDSLQQQLEIDKRLLAMTQAGLALGTASNDDLLTAEDTLDLVIADLQTTQTAREQDEHAIAVLTGVPPGSFSLAPRLDYKFAALAVPLVLPSELLERRYDVVNAERTAAAANAKIGVAEAAFFPTLDLSAEGGFQHNALANLFSLPNRFWSVGPSLAETLFDGGARSAAVREARATYDSDVANYRQTVLSAFQSVENSLSSCNHLKEEAQAYAGILRRNQSLFDSQHAQYTLGTASEQTLLTQQLILLQAAQNLKDTQASLTTSTVTLIENLGGGWQWDNSKGAAVSNPMEPPGIK